MHQIVAYATNDEEATIHHATCVTPAGSHLSFIVSFIMESKIESELKRAVGEKKIVYSGKEKGN